MLFVLLQVWIFFCSFANKSIKLYFVTTTTLVMKEELLKLKQIFSHRVVLLAAVVMMAAMSVQIKAQNFPVGVVSTQDSVKGFQLGIISSVAPDGGRGVQFAGVSNTSVGVFNGDFLQGSRKDCKGWSFAFTYWNNGNQ